MKSKWMIPVAVALLALVLMVVWIQGASQAQVPQANLTLTKTVDKSIVAPGESVVYTVTFSNTTGSTVTVASLVDTLPIGFDYIGLAPGSEWTEEAFDKIPPEIQWAGPITVPMSDTLTLCYWVNIPPYEPLSGTPYTNTVTATVGSETYEAKAGVLVGIGEVSVVKTAVPLKVLSGEDVTYTIAFSNSGYITVPLNVVTDVLPAQVSFVEMTDLSDVDAPPVGVTGTITWTGPFTIPAHGEFVVEFRAKTPVVSDTFTLENKAWGRLGDSTIISDSVAVQITDLVPKPIYLPAVVHGYAPAAFSVSKTADPTVVYNIAPGGIVTYEVVFTNTGTDPGVLADIRDTLPAGFVFQNMVAGSDVTTPPTGTQGEIVWTGPFDVPGKGMLKLTYQVRATTVIGTYENSVTATTSEGRPPDAPAKAAVKVATPTLLEEDWEAPSPYWEEFLNYPRRLHPGQWHIDWGIGRNGSRALNHTYWIGTDDPEDYGAHDALYLYHAPGAEQWKNYRFEAMIKFNQGETQGLWFRAKYEPSDLGGRHVEGYYLVWRPQADWIRLFYINNEGKWAYHFADPVLLLQVDHELSRKVWYKIAVEVRGSNIRAFVDDVEVINFDNDIYSEGTVGFKTYKFIDGAWDNIVVTELP